MWLYILRRLARTLAQLDDPSTTVSGSAERDPADPAERIRRGYVRLMGHVPASIEERIAVAQRTGRLDAVESIEALRRVLLTENALGPKHQQLVHFGQLVVLAREDLARGHAAAAQRAGATPAELMGVVETALITAGVPAYSLGVRIVAELLEIDQRG